MRARSGWLLLGLLGVVAGLSGLAFKLRGGAGAASSDLVIYAGGLAPGWQDWSWAMHRPVSSEVTFNGQRVLKMEPDGFKGVYLHCDALDTTAYDTLAFWVHGGKMGGQQISVCAVDDKKNFGPKLDVGKTLPMERIVPNKWTLAIIPLERLKAAKRTITGFCFQEAKGEIQPDLYFADIRLTGRPGPGGNKATSGPITVTIDTSQAVHPISPLIYGMAGADSEMIRDLRLGLNRWGGNPNTRYNWEKGNCWNAARDWEFRNGNYNNTSPEDRQPSGVADKFVTANKAAGAAALLTIPTVGYVARDDNNETRSLNVPSKIGPGWGIPAAPGSEATAYYDPRDNQRRTSVKSYARKRGPLQDPPNLADEAVYQDEWIYHLTRRFGKAAAGGVRYYAMDNEPDLWDTTHTDIHPVAPGYDDLLANFLDYATAVKAVDPTAQVTGPVLWGWTGYLHSPRDRGDYSGRPDRRAHGDMPLIPWFLDQVHKHDQRTGKRSLDVLDIHFYPQGQGVYQGATDAQTSALRIRSTRALWDPSYPDESWIRDPVRLIPRMKEWIARYYPGTKLGLTEWNWGADGTMNGGIAVAECLGIFGREGIDLANYWTKPAKGSPGYFAFKMFRNADGKGTGLGDRSVRATTSAPNEVSCYAGLDTRTGEPAAILINQNPSRDSTVTVRVKHAKPLKRARLWRYEGSNKGGITALPDSRVENGGLRLAVPGYSITLLRLE